MADETENTEKTPAVEAAAAQAAKPEPEPVVAPKERKARAKAAKAKPVKAPLTPGEKHDVRLAERKKKAIARTSERAQSREKAKAMAHQAAVTPPRPHVEGIQKTRQGIVVSDKAEKTITVRIDVARRHRRYEKIVRSSNTIHAHDENNDAHEGDVVRVIESRPLSRTKRWALVDVLERAR
jgi:small subunit ribosomal protein S17